MKTWKAVVGIIAVFVLGMLAGGLLCRGVMRHRIQHPGEVVVRRLNWRLHLDATQREQLRGIVADARKQIDDVRRQVRPQIETILSQSEDQVRAILRPDQVEIFNKIVAERKARREASLPPPPPPKN
jgi:hypothetical protein